MPDRWKNCRTPTLARTGRICDDDGEPIGGARLVINSADFSAKLSGFNLSCTKCGSKAVTLDVDWAAYPSASWCKVTAICDACHHDEEVYESV